MQTNVRGSHNVIEAARAARRAVGRLPQHRQGRLPRQRDGDDEGAHGEDRAGLRPQPPRLADDRLASPATATSCTRAARSSRCSSSSSSAGKPLTLTEPTMTRFLMSLEESVDLVEHAFSHAEPGDLFVRKAPACTVETLARAVASRSRRRRSRDPRHRHAARREALRDAAHARGDGSRPRTRATTSGCRSTRGRCSTSCTSRRASAEDSRARRLHLATTPSSSTSRRRKALLLTLPEIQALRRSGRVRVVVTGADGFLGWHTRLRLRRADRPRGRRRRPRETGRDLREPSRGVDAIIHLAGVNRARTTRSSGGNIALADDSSRRVRATGRARASSTRTRSRPATGRPTDGQGGGRASCSPPRRRAGGRFVDVRLPNLFGEHGRPATTRSSRPSPTRSSAARRRRSRTGRSSCSMRRAPRRRSSTR